MRLFSIVYRGAPTILALASIVIAVLVAYMQMEQKQFLQNIEQKSHQTDRTISIMNAFYSSPSYQNLSRLGDAIVYEQHRRLLSNEDRNTSREVYLELTKGKRKEVGSWLVHFIRTLDTIYYCGRRSQEASRIPCDRLLLIQVYFEELAWMFFQVRYGIYCDPVIKEIFAHHGFDDEAGSAIYRLETMLLEYWEHEAHGRRLTLTPISGPGGSSPMRPERWSCPSWPVPASGSRCSSGAVVGYRRSRCTRIAQPWPRAG